MTNKNTIMRSEFATMSTEELKELIHNDCMTATDDQLDIDAIMLIMEVIEQRESTDNLNQNKNKNQNLNQISSLSTLEDFKTNRLNSAQHSPTPNHTQKRKSRRSIRLLIALVAVMVCTVSASAFHFNLFQMFADWTDTSFQFISQLVVGTSAQDNDPLFELRDLVEGDVGFHLVPHWCPAGFDAVDTQEYALMTKHIYKATLVQGEDEIIVTITHHQNGVDNYTYTSEKEALDAIQLEQNGITHYILVNTDTTTASWLNGEFVCEIFGDISPENLERMIESMYEG